MNYEKSTRGVPQVPPNIEAWEMVDIGRQQNDNEATLEPHADTDPKVTPYLGLRARLSQVWLNRWTILLMLILARVIILSGSLNDNISDAKEKALSSCTKVEDIGSAMASMPHYLSVGVNSMAAKGISKTVQGMVEILMMILTGVQSLILFIINFYIGTYVCLIGALIHGGLDVATHVVEGATKIMNDAIGPISSGIASEASTVQDAINVFTSKVNLGVGGALGITIPSIDLTPRLNDLKNIKIDGSSLVADLTQLNKNIPTFDQAENLTKNAISVPFDMVKKLVKDNLGNYSFDESVFPVAEKQALDFCSSNSFLNDFFTNLFEVVSKAKTAFIVVLIILAILSMVIFSYLEIRGWRREKQRAKFFTEKGFDPLDIVYMASRRYTAGAGVKIAAKFRSRDERRYLLTRWAIAYATSLPALFVLSLAVTGFLSCLCQYIMLRGIQNEAPQLANQVGDFTGKVVTTLENVSTSWANDANGVVLDLQKDINDDLFGWVLTATSAVNDTLNTIDKEIEKGIEFAFNDTILLNTARDIVKCLIGRKIDSVQEGLTWVHDNAHVTLPLFANDTFSQGASDSVNGDSDLTSFLASPSSVTTDEISGAVDKVAVALQNSIIQEALISLVLLLIYIFVVLIGIITAICGMVGPDKTRGEGGQRFNGQSFAHPQYPPPPAPVDASPDYDEVVYAGSVPRGKTHFTPLHDRKSSYPEYGRQDH
ncbi:plasma membrane fusion protein PRM1 [Bombardia bombarda]|uniref:Plasma membrane fusion protein PRM1 n=1 Tax=Bombardia bombarda TaxID=252184 RepID=A0AA39XJP3_9PEZI|nr:plasma membrane fusion protein PRM1 [Bombardia bombarda]